MMKKFFATLLCLALVAGLFAACSGSKDNNAKADSKKVGIAVLSENGAFTDMRTGIESKLKEKYGDNVTCVYKNAAGDAASLSTIVSDFDNGDYDAVFTIATPATQAFVNQESETPCFFCAVSDPVAAKVMTALDTPDKNATGTSNAIPVSEIIDMGYKLTPDVKKWGFIYSTSQVNATSTVKAAEKYLDSKKIAYAEKTVENSADVKSVTQSLIDGGCDVIFVPNDSVVQDGVSALTELCQEKKIPTYCSSATTVASGCTATLAIDDKGIGEKTAEMAIQYFDGKKVAEIPAQVCGIDYCSVNKTALAAGGLATPTRIPLAMRSRCWKQQNKQQKSQTGGRAARCACYNFFIPKGTRTYALSHCPTRGLTVRTVGAGRLHQPAGAGHSRPDHRGQLRFWLCTGRRFGCRGPHLSVPAHCLFRRHGRPD